MHRKVQGRKRQVDYNLELMAYWLLRHMDEWEDSGSFRLGGGDVIEDVKRIIAKGYHDLKVELQRAVP